MSLTKQPVSIPSHAILSFVSGIVILVSGFVFYLWHFAFFPSMSPMMGAPLNASGELLSVAIVICGVVITAMAVMMIKRPSENKMWGIFVIIFSAMSILEMGGFLIGGILGIIGGIMAIINKPSKF